MPDYVAQGIQNLRVPDILSHDLATFHAAHFSNASVTSFEQKFISPNAESLSYYEENGAIWEEDCLGYYEDGVKRTLTDEQIEIFRHSEFRELERAKERGTKLRKSEAVLDETDVPDGQPTATPIIKARDGKKVKKRQNKQPRREPKPDLRKRTWDVVEAGVDSLDYD